MGFKSKTINYSLSDYLDDKYWIRLEQVKNSEDTATLSDMAEIIDKVYSIDPCVTPVTSDPSETPETPETPASPEYDPFVVEPPVIEDVFRTIIRDYFPMEMCQLDGEGNYTTQVKVILSNPGEPYSLKVDGGKVMGNPLIVEEDIDDSIIVEDVSGVVLDYPVVGDIKFEWGNSSNSKPKIYRIGNTLNWGSSVTGSIRVQYPTRYELVDVLILGVLTDGVYEPGEGTVIGFYHGMVDELELEVPEEDEGDDNYRDNYCGLRTRVVFPEDPAPKPQWVTTEKYWNCTCSNDYDHSVYSDPPTAAQLRADQFVFPGITKRHFEGYVDCGVYDEYLFDPEFYLENCCTSPPFVLPKCRTVYRKHGGNVPFEDAEDYGNIYGEYLRLIPISPVDNDCGYTKYVQKVNALDCCEDVVALSWDPLYSPYVAPALYHFLGGKGPFTIHVTGQGFSLNKYKIVKTIEIFEHWFRVYLLDGHCGAGSIKVTDSCDQELPKSIRSPEGQWIPSATLSDWSSCVVRYFCCTGSWGNCNIGAPDANGQCYDYYSGGLNYISIYHPEWEIENGQYKIVRIGCEGSRNCVPPDSCMEGDCSVVDGVSGISYMAVLDDPCSAGFGDRVFNTRYEWVC